MRLETQLAYAVLTGSTCGDACWHAREEVCRCSCGGANHGILNKGGDRPQRTCKIDGNFYELAAVVSREGCDAPIEFWDKVDTARREVLHDRFPNIDHYAYGQFRQEKTMPVVDRKVTDTQAKWPEVAAVAGALRLVWARPKGSGYWVKGENHKPVYKG